MIHLLGKPKYNVANDKRIKKLCKEMRLRNLEEPFKMIYVIEFLEKIFDSDESYKTFTETLFKSRQALSVVEDLEEYFMLKSALADKLYYHYKKNKLYRVITVAIPVTNKILDDFVEVLHTEDEIKIPIYYYKDYYYHNYNDEVLVIYTDEKETYARPYEMFFENVEVNGEVKPRFKEATN